MPAAPSDPTHDDDEFVAVGTAIDLDNCAREPIHIPGSVQPRGVLAVVREPDFEIRQVSANAGELLGRPAAAVLHRHLSALIGVDEAARIQKMAATFGDLRQRNPLECTIEVDGEPRPFDAILHRQPGGVLVVELEIAYGERPFSFPNTYQAVRGSVEELNRATSLSELYDTTVRAVRDLTGFDRVMIYRYDDEYNGEVVAETKREDLNSLLGLHYPASDIPAQARAMYEKSWLRLISDVEYTPVPLIPVIDPDRAAPLDLTHATLRSVSPIHLEYLQNMGVHASMSISLLRHGRLWGLIACHHYAGPHLPPFGARVAAEFLGSTLSLRMVDQFDEDQLHQRLAVNAILAKLIAATMNDDEPLTDTVLGAPDLLDLVPGDGVVVEMQGERREVGVTPDREQVAQVVAWARESGDDVVSSECLSRTLPTLGVDPGVAAGALAISLPDNQFVVWFRREHVRSVDWGGDPHNKAIAVQEGDDVRLSPRKSFDRWRETMHDRSEPWTDPDTESAGALRRHLVESLYRRTRGALRVAETLQRSLLPSSLPQLENWSVSAHYEPAAGGRIGGDWYDAFTLPDGRLIVLLGDVAGHGIPAAGTMAQLRSVLRAHLFTGTAPAEALQRLNEFCLHLLPRTFATSVVARIDLESGYVEAGCAGQLMPYLVDSSPRVTPVPLQLSPPIGVVGARYAASAFTVRPGDTVVAFSDGLVERRRIPIDDGLDRLALLLGGSPDMSASAIADAMASSDSDDDITVVTLHRDSP